MTSLSDAYARLCQWFDWQSGAVPLSGPEAPALGVSFYLVGIFGLRAALGGSVCRVPPLLAALHNFILCSGSAVMLAGCAYEAMQEARRLHSFQWLFCLDVGTHVKGPLYFWSYIYYLSKYYELLDTVILVLKGRALTFLHVAHHSMVLVMAYLWLECSQSLQVLALLFNTGVHVFMYFYYFMCSIGRPPKWKKAITNIQIWQFVSSFLLSVPFWWIHYTVKPCSGFQAMVFNTVFNLMLLFLFANFHRKSYAQTKPKQT
mmetsp:Transcript_16125/g.41911  ORF Transcript_16125/g.41911 Transcript_16125/m.41911 type:complete len:260 (-) Transcript_16125:96-875(-)